ncbi:MAG TPA: SLC13 family permease [Thermodesulfobacteriota bacterium]
MRRPGAAAVWWGAAFGAAVAARLLPPAAGLTSAGQAVLGVALGGMLLWMTEALPLGVTAILVLGLLGTVPGLAPTEAFVGFASPVVFFLVGALALGLAVERTGLAARAARRLLAGSRGKPARLYAHMLAGFAPLALLLPSAITRNAILVPAYRDALAAMGAGPRAGRAVMLALAVLNTLASSALLTGGVSSIATATLLGGFTWTSWFALMAVPYYTLIALGGLVLYRLLGPFEPGHGRPPADEGPAPPLTGAERRTLAILALTSLLWLTDAIHGLSPAVPALLGASLVLAPGIGVLEWQAFESRLSWGLLLTVGASLSLARALETTGAADWLAGLATRGLGAADLPPAAFLAALVTAVAVVHLGITNLPACIALLVPVGSTVGAAAGLNPVVCGLVVAITVDTVILYPVQTASSLLAYESGMFRAGDVRRFGVMLWLVTIAVVIGVAVPWWTLMGLPLARP